jgi:hypothetical protein
MKRESCSYELVTRSQPKVTSAQTAHETQQTKKFSEEIHKLRLRFVHTEKDAAIFRVSIGLQSQTMLWAS